MAKRVVGMGVDNFKNFFTFLFGFLPGVKSVSISSEMVIINLDPSSLEDIFLLLSKNQRFRFLLLMDIWATDTMNSDSRFEVNYSLLSVRSNFRLFLRVSLSEMASLPSITHIYNSAGWLEREVWDMFGILFYNNRDLRRILTDYGFEGHPLRKDFPLSGYNEVRYDDGDKRVVYEPLELSQEYRTFLFFSPWSRV